MRDFRLRAVGCAAWIVAAASCGSTSTAPDPGSGATPVGVRISEVHYDNAGTDVNEAIELNGPAGTSITGWQLVLYNGSTGAPYDTRTLSGTIPATCATRGVRVEAYPENGIQNGSPDAIALVNALGVVVEFISYEGTVTAVGGPADGWRSMDIGVVELGNEAPGLSLQRDAAGAWSGPFAATFGTCNGAAPPPPSHTISVSGRSASDPPLPVGFEDQLFATVRNASGQVVPTTVTWRSETPTLASIDANGVVHALGPGEAVLRATAADGLTTVAYTLPTRVGLLGAAALYAGNTEFGEPNDADASDDVVVRHLQYTASYSPRRGTPNWVSYDLEASHFGAEDRCDCFTFDPALPPGLTRLTTADYTGVGAFHGYAIDRGHLVRSFDRTAGSLDNAFTYYFTNIVPQAADLNQGPWAAMEIHLSNLARQQGLEVYVIAGVAGSKGTVKGEGRIVIPASTWKVAVVLPRDQGLAAVEEAGDAQVIAAIMPNEPGIRNVDWNSYRTTVDAVEALSGYDLLALLPDSVENVVEGTRASGSDSALGRGADASPRPSGGAVVERTSGVWIRDQHIRMEPPTRRGMLRR
ncbi:MAG: DNA/RNA non-specific endonuclease [Gemmatimonadaceae bacterium]|nr:DNA/RNA non-specific endonuclease [Gemmatimonadaceae bacterium]